MRENQFCDSFGQVPLDSGQLWKQNSIYKLARAVAKCSCFYQWYHLAISQICKGLTFVSTPSALLEYLGCKSYSSSAAHLQTWTSLPFSGAEYIPEDSLNLVWKHHGL